MADPVVNLFLLEFADRHPLSSWPWYGVDGWAGRISACALVVPERLMVPFAPVDAHARRLGRRIRRHHTPCMMVGPRAACDAIWEEWAPRVHPVRWHDQQLYAIADPPALPPLPGLRRAVWDEWEALARLGAEMQLEDMDVDPRVRDGERHDELVQERVRAGRTYVVEQGGQIVYTVNVGTRSQLGSQLGGTYVPPEFRGRGIATAATAEVTRRLLDRHPRVTLHVNEANRSAVRVYEKVGFLPVAPYRLATIA
ncbi:MAG: ribosomal protein S18 acetylase RimI-like enzyme [Myxococcota bacterium]|jgi:ribosomal protein S18 acetylase RimI-like enzyme